MIPFGSQRGGGGDLATHLSNSHDNEYVEVHDLRGAIANDLHGAFADWEAQAHAMTKAKNYLYSLSVNPDPEQGRLTREQYEDYINRAEDQLGLSDQPRAIVFHIKESLDGHLREHCHVVWSRIDIQNCRAIPISFDKQKLMGVTRGFALDHGLKLPDGYHTGRSQTSQRSFYDNVQTSETGLTREERMELVTDLWRSSDSPSALVAALSDNGYILATGKRPYVLVDVYGHTNTLPKMIADRQVRTKDIRGFLENEYPPESLPSVDEAKDMAANYRRETQQLIAKEQLADELEMLEASQGQRREKLESLLGEKAMRHRQEQITRNTLEADQRAALGSEQARVDLQISSARDDKKPSGLVQTLSKVSGFTFLQGKFHDRQDRRRAEQQRLEHEALNARLRDDRMVEERRQALEMMELRRKQSALEMTFAREKCSIDKAHVREQALQYRKGHEHMPSLSLTLTPGGRGAILHLAKRRFTSPTVKELNVKARPRRHEEEVNVQRDFTVAAKPQTRQNTGGGKGLSDDFTIREPGKGRKR